MNSRKVFYILIASQLAIVGLFVATLVYGNKFLTTKSSVLNTRKVERTKLENTQQSLAKTQKDILKYSELNEIMAGVVPQEKDQARTVREIIKIAESSGVAISSFSFPSSTLGSSGTTRTQATSPGSMSQTTRVEGVDGVEQMQITITSALPVPYDNFLGFLQKLEQNRRTSQVSSVTITPEPQNRSLIRFSLIVNVYIKKVAI